MYATLSDMQTRYGEDLLRVASKPGTVELDTAAVQLAIDDAASIIDGYLAGRYPLPLAHVPTALVPICCDIARYRLYGEQAPEQIGKRFDAAVAFLKSVGKGELALGLSAEGDSLESSNLATIQSDGRVFGRDKGGFI